MPVVAIIRSCALSGCARQDGSRSWSVPVSSSDGAPMTPLRQRLIQDMQLRNLAPETIRGYVYYVARFAKYFGRSPEQLTPEHARQYQLHLLEKKVSWSTFNQSVCALRFFYGTTLGRKDYVKRLPYGKKPKRVPVVLSREEVLKFLQGILSRKQRMLLTTMYATPRHLGAQIGGLMVLHTWGQTLELHPHVHVIVPGGGLSPDGTRWISCKPGFFLPVRVLSRLLRGKLLAFLKQAYDRKELSWTGGLAPLADPQQFARFLSPLYQKEWAVYAQPPHNGPEQALKYLARYTYRVAISNERIESLDDGEVTFRYKAYAHGHRLRRMTLTARSSCGGSCSTCSPAGSSASAASACWPIGDGKSNWPIAGGYCRLPNRRARRPALPRSTAPPQRRSSHGARSAARGYSSLSPGLRDHACQNWWRAPTNGISSTAHESQRISVTPVLRLLFSFHRGVSRPPRASRVRCAQIIVTTCISGIGQEWHSALSRRTMLQ